MSDKYVTERLSEICVDAVREIIALRGAVIEYNAALRSANSVAERNGADTNWSAFRGQITAVLERHHHTFADRASPVGNEEMRLLVECKAATESLTAAESDIERLRGTLSYLRTQARNGTLHPQVVIQNADKVLGKQDA